jgi:quinol monooxygenase YgiN
MFISLVVSGIGAVVAAIGGGVLLARCFREPRGDIIAWSVALLGLLISLGSQALGHLAGFDAAMFRAMELGGQVIAPLAIILALSEVAAKSTAVRFCARLYIPALAIVAAVVLTLDQLAQATFTKAWPDPSVFYQTPPDYVLMFAIGPVTALVAIIAVGTVLIRSGQPGWNAVLPAQLMGGAAALALAYPALAQLVAYLVGIHLPVSSLFAVLCTIAAGLTWLAGMQTGRLRLAALRATGAAPQPWDRGGPLDGADRTGDFARFEPATDGGVYRGGGLYRPDRPGQNATRDYQRDQEDPGAGWHDDQLGGGHDDWRSDDRSGREDWGRYDDERGDAGHRDGYQTPDFATGDFAPGDFANGDFATGDFAPGDFASGAGGWQSRNDAHDRLERYDHPEPERDVSGRYSPGWPAEGAGGPGEDPARSRLFGQIAIYTLLEDRVNEFDKLTQLVVDQVRSREPDTLVFIVHAVPSAPMQRILYEVYRDRDAYQWHLRQPHVTQFEADRRPYVLATNVIELGLQQAKVSPFPSVSELFGEPGYDTSGFERPDYLRDYGRTSAQPGNGTREYR